MAVITSFNVQYYTASGRLYGTYNIKFYDTNYGTEDTPEYYSSSPGLSGYTSAYVEDAYGESLGMEVLDDGSFMTNSEDWMFVLSSATGPLKVYSSDFEGGGGGNTPSTGVLQGTTHVALVDENNGQVIWEEDVNLYTGGDEYTPYIEGRLSIPQDLLNQYTGWYVVSGYYYDSFDNGYLIFYTWDDTLFNEDLVIMGYRNYVPEETITIYYEDPTGYHGSESDSYSCTPGEGVSFYPRDWSDRTDANGNRFLRWEDADGIQYTAEFSYYAYHNLTLYAVWETSGNPDFPTVDIVYYMSENDLTIYATDVCNEETYTIPSHFIPTRNGYEFLYWDYPDNGESWYPGATFYPYTNPVILYGVWREIDPDAPVITGEEVYFVKVNGIWHPGKMYFKINGTWN